VDIRQLKHFLAVAKWHNFGRAAEKLSITQQALSYSIVQLEKSLNVKLLERGPFGAEATEIGKALEQRALLICAELELARAEVQALRGGVQGTVRVGVGNMVASGILPQVMTLFCKTHPKVGVCAATNHSQGLYEGLLAGEFDFVVATPQLAVENDPDLRHEPIGNSLLFNANFLLMRAGHPLASLRPFSLDTARKFPWILPSNQSVFQQTIMNTFHRNDLAPPAYILRTDSLLLAKSVVLPSDFVTLVAKESVAHEINAGLLTGVPIPGLSAPLSGCFSFVRRSTLQPAAAALVQCFKTVIAECRRPQIALVATGTDLVGRVPGGDG
jgi:DNA-binding transcriptional LysR family regulator